MATIVPPEESSAIEKACVEVLESTKRVGTSSFLRVLFQRSFRQVGGGMSGLVTHVLSI